MYMDQSLDSCAYFWHPNGLSVSMWSDSNQEYSGERSIRAGAFEMHFIHRDR